MYRAALEQLLHEQGFTTAMRSTKISALEAAVNDSTSTVPPWSHRLEPAFLKVIKDLGNGATHTNGGDVSKQDALDAALLQHVRITMQELLDPVYEEPKGRAQRLATLQPLDLDTYHAAARDAMVSMTQEEEAKVNPIESRR